MSNAKMDENSRNTLIALSNLDGTTIVDLWADPVTHRLLVDASTTSPLTTKGDIFVYSTADTRLPVGTNGQVLTADSTQTTGLKWATPTTGLTVGTTAITGGASGNVLIDTAGVLQELGYSTTATASNLVERDSNANIYVNNFFSNSTSVVSAGGTTVLTVASSRNQTLTGSSSQTFQLPNATTLPLSHIYTFNNNSSGSLIITDNSTATQYTAPAGGYVQAILLDNSTATGVWDFHAMPPKTVTWSSGSTGLIFNTALTTTPQINSGASSSTSPSFIPQRGSSTTGFGGDSSNLYGIIAGVAKMTLSATNMTVPAVNKVTITTPATGSTLTIADGKTLTVNNTLTLAGTDSTTMTFPSTSATIARTDAGQTFTGTQVFTSPKIITSVLDTNGNTLINIGATASAVNYVKVTNAATGTAGPILSADGETNVDLKLAGKGTGKVHQTTGTYGDLTADTDGATITFDMSVSNLHGVTLGGNRTLAVSNVATGQSFSIRLKQDATGSRTVTWFSGISWPGGTTPTLTTTASKADWFTFVCTGAGAYDGFVVALNM